MPTTTEQQYEAEFLRQRIREENIREDAGESMNIEDVDISDIEIAGDIRRHIYFIELSLFLPFSITVDALQLLSDGFTAIPYIGTILNIATDAMLGIAAGMIQASFILWLVVSKRAGIFSTGRLLSRILIAGIVTLFIEFFPYLSSLPVLTLNIMVTTWIYNKHIDELYEKIGGSKILKSARVFLNL